MAVNFILLSALSQRRPFNGIKSRWVLMNPFGNASWAFHVYEAKLDDPALILTGHATCFVREDAARLELDRQKTLGDEIKPRLYVAIAFTRKGAIKKVLDQAYANIGHSVERIV